MRNLTKVQEIPFDNEVIKREKAKEFSEGCLELERLLNCVWNKGIETCGCCAGHVEEEIYPYINFVLKQSSGKYLNYLLNYLQNSSELNVDINLSSYGDRQVAVGVYCKHEDKELVFSIIDNMIENYSDSYQMLNENLYSYVRIREFLLQHQISVRLNFSNSDKQMLLGLYSFGSVINFNKNEAGSLLDNIKLLLETNRFCTGLFIAEKECLSFFANLLPDMVFLEKYGLLFNQSRGIEK